MKNDLIKTVTDFHEQALESRRSNIDYINSHDELRDIIDNLTHGRIGEEPNQNFIDEINKEGAIRYKYKTGPGYADASGKKDERFSFNGVNYDAQFGDLYIWKQIINEAKNKKYNNVIYVTNDEKEDFVYKINGKLRGPSESLVTEMKRQKNIKIFLLHQIDSFLHHAVKSLNAKIDEPSITELSSAAASTLGLALSSIPGMGSTRSVFKSTISLMEYEKHISKLRLERDEITVRIRDLDNKLQELEDKLLLNESLDLRFSIDKEKFVIINRLKRLNSRLDEINELILENDKMYYY